MAVGLFMAACVFYFMKFLYAQEATSTVGEAHLVGQEGVVLTSIPAGGTGEVRMNVRGTTIKSLARAESGEEVAAGATVRVVQEVGGTLVVRPVRL
jgi:membrane protein implicated in regulation of membrane protease activity